MPFRAFDHNAFDSNAFFTDLATATVVSGSGSGETQIIVRPRRQPVPQKVSGRAHTSQKFLLQVGDKLQAFGSQVTLAKGSLRFSGKAATAQPGQQTFAEAKQTFVGSVASAQPAAGQTKALGGMIDVELEMMLGIIQAA